jgi:hypothetical protein
MTPGIYASAPLVTDWMQAFADIAGQALTVASIILGVFVLRHEIRKRKEEDLEAKSAQARLIVPSVRMLTHPTTDGESAKIRVNVRNYSASPAVDLCLVIDHRLGQSVHHADDLLSGATWTQDTETTRDEDLQVTVYFVDAAGLLWKRLSQSIQPEHVKLVDRQHIPFGAEYMRGQAAYLSDLLRTTPVKDRPKWFLLSSIRGKAVNLAQKLSRRTR